MCVLVRLVADRLRYTVVAYLQTLTTKTSSTPTYKESTATKHAEFSRNQVCLRSPIAKRSTDPWCVFGETVRRHQTPLHHL